MEKCYKYRIYPNAEQVTLIQKTFGCCRYVFNRYLGKRIEKYKSDKSTLNYNDCSADMTVPQFFSSSQNCHVCGYKNAEVKNLKVRAWVCPKCGASHDRDVNAAKNILNKGMEMFSAV